MPLGDKDWIDLEIHREHTLTSNRMNWYVASQAFLLTALATGAMKGNELGSVFPILLPILGILISIVSLTAIMASIRTIDVLRRKHIEQCKEKDQYFIDFWYTKRECEHALGNLPPKMIPILFVVTWCCLLFFQVIS